MRTLERDTTRRFEAPTQDKPAIEEPRSPVKRRVPRATRQVITGAPKSVSFGDVVTLGIHAPSGAMPFGDVLQRAFGRHDLGDLQVHRGAATDAACDELGAHAFARGNQIALGKDGGDLHTVAHEAVHAIQQRAGVHVAGGVGQAGDAHERQADAIAEAVVRGERVEHLLDAIVGSGAATSAVQLRPMASTRRPRIRVQATLDSPVLSVLQPGQVIEAEDPTADGWSRVTAPVEGFVRAEYLAPATATDAPAAAPAPTTDAPAPAPTAAAPTSDAPAPTTEAPAASASIAPIGGPTEGRQPTAASEAEVTAMIATAVNGPSANLTMSPAARALVIASIADGRPSHVPIVGAAADDPSVAAWVGALTEAQATFAAYEAQVHTARFLGAPVKGHAEFLARLRIAEARLEADKKASGRALGRALGIDDPGGSTDGWNLRHSADPHGLGTAVDLNYGSNPYVFGDSENHAGNEAFTALARHALEFSGLPIPEHLMPQGGTGRQGAAWDQMNQLDRAIERYFSMLSATPRGIDGPVAGAVLANQVDPSAHEQATRNVRALLAGRGQTPTDAQVEAWVGRITADFAARQDRSTSNWASGRSGNRQDVGVMNMPRELPVAMCDVGGMRWGASGFGETASGDTMHFDATEVIELGPDHVSNRLANAQRLHRRYDQQPVETWRRPAPAAPAPARRPRR